MNIYKRRIYTYVESAMRVHIREGCNKIEKNLCEYMCVEDIYIHQEAYLSIYMWKMYMHI